jgi:hypothetical protein
MQGWTRDGREVELTRWQEHAVRQLLDGSNRQVRIVCRGRGFGWSMVLATAARYDRHGVTLPPPSSSSP